MPRLSYSTAGESHGPGILALVSGVPAGVPIDTDFINAQLLRRQGGYGRGARQRIEHDAADILSGVRRGRSIGSPIALLIRNNDSRLDDLARTPPVHRPRPGHADLAGSVKWLTTDCRETLERASARETAARVAAGAVARLILREFNIESFGFVRSIHLEATTIDVREDSWRSLLPARDASDVYCPDPDASERMVAAVRQAKINKDTVGGVVETHVFGCPLGLGTCANWQDRIDSRIAAAVMGIQAFKAVEIGLGLESTRRTGAQLHDPIRFDRSRESTPTGSVSPSLGFTRDSNNAGGSEGGITNGQPVVVRGAMKPIATLLQGLPSIDLNTKEPQISQYERSDICAVPAASVVMEHAVAFEIAAALLDKTGGDSLLEARQNYDLFLKTARTLPLEPPIAGPLA